MSRVRFYLDEDTMRKSLVFALRARGADVLTASEAGMLNCSDRDHLVIAASLNRVIYTFNGADFCARTSARFIRLLSRKGRIRPEY